MDRLWSPWRYAYVSTARAENACIFCEKAADGRDEENYILYRAPKNFVLLNLFPYTTGHLMIAPYEHVATLEEAAEETLVEMMLLTRLAERHLRTVYKPRGFNVGMNIGECAGAGVAGHLHMHVLPRWPADSNFMTTIGETRVLPEELSVTYDKLRRAFKSL
ncbi:MAG: HIT domain-containing protein [Bryobacterales bacterium]|nr:HIT domain-containing protein [Bryobacteraceae bacterium]MDW8354708.1 HIT domain-containing protein [Bryobacterales bacterium]